MINSNNQLITKSYTQSITKQKYPISGSYIIGQSQEYKRVKEQIDDLNYNDTQLSYVLESIRDISVFEHRTEHLRDLLLEDRTALSEQEILQLKIIFNKSQKLIDWNLEKGQLILLALASLLEPLIENAAYSQEIAIIVRTLLKSSVKTLRYAGLDIIVAGMDIVPIANQLLEEAKILLKNEESGYVLDHLESL